MRIGIVYGGWSTEKDASARNAAYIHKALTGLGYDALLVEYQRNMIGVLHENGCDFVYLCVQGKGHGDGTLQGMLEQEGIPYTGTKTQGAALINHKILCKLLFDHQKIATPPWEMLFHAEYCDNPENAKKLPYPFVAKAPTQGGSFGIVLVNGDADLSRIASVFTYDDPILLEAFIAGGFYTVGLLEREGELVTLPCVQGVEVEQGVDVVNPQQLTLFTGDFRVEKANLPVSLLAQMDADARKIFKITGAQDMARVDFMVDEKANKVWTLEINAVPGLKPQSLLPRAAALAGIAYEDLIEGVLDSAMRHYRK